MQTSEIFSDVEFHSFHWDNFNLEILAHHKKVMKFFNIEIRYTQKNIPHGQWLDEVLRASTSDIIAIIEPDLVPLNKEIIINSINYVREYKTFLGCAQVSNHIPPYTHVFASPSFFFIHRTCYEKLGLPSFMPTRRGDVAEELSYLAEENGIKYRALYPSLYETAPKEGCWALGNYGFYGIGTVFSKSVYHLFQSRNSENVELFVRMCNEILSGAVDFSRFTSCHSLQQPDNIYIGGKKKKKLIDRVKKILL